MVEVHLKKGRSVLTLEVKDNGIGIPAEKLSDHNSYGLIGIRERARYLGGDARIVGVPGWCSQLSLISRWKAKWRAQLKILIADDHALFREGLKDILRENFDGAVLDQASNGYEVLDKTSTDDYDLLLLDIAMPGISGPDVLKQLRVIRPKLRVLVLSMYPEGQYAVRDRLRASGYLTKRSASDELIEAIKKVSKGSIYVTAAIGEKLMVDFRPDTGKPPHELLSDREFQIFCMIASGKTVSTIAEELNLSVKTVSTHRVHILEKMKMKNNAELTNYGIKYQVINLTD